MRRAGKMRFVRVVLHPDEFLASGRPLRRPFALFHHSAIPVWFHDGQEFAMKATTRYDAA